MNNINLLKQYKENEDLNNHAENFILLAENFGDDYEKYLAKVNFEHREKFGWVDPDLSRMANSSLRKYYYILTR